MLLLYRVVPFASCLMFYGHHRKESDFRSNNGILLKLISMLHAIMLSVRVMSICFHKISNIQNNFKFEQSLHSLGPHHLCFFACTIKRWNQQKSFQRLKMGKKSRRHPENGEGHIGKQEGRDRPLPRIHILRKNREATCSEIRTSGTVISGSVS